MVATKLDNGIKPYAEIGTVLSAKDGVEILMVAEVGASIPLRTLFAKAKFEHKWGEDDARDWKFPFAPSTSFDI